MRHEKSYSIVFKDWRKGQKCSRLPSCTFGTFFFHACIAFNINENRNKIHLNCTKWVIVQGIPRRMNNRVTEDGDIKINGIN